MGDGANWLMGKSPTPLGQKEEHVTARAGKLKEIFSLRPSGGKIWHNVTFITPGKRSRTVPYGLVVNHIFYPGTSIAIAQEKD
jgi:hypothetical protein